MCPAGLLVDDHGWMMVTDMKQAKLVFLNDNGGYEHG